MPLYLYKTMRTTIFLVVILIIFSCQKQTSEKDQNTVLNTEIEITNPKKSELNDTIIYLSDNNDLALIKLTLFPNRTFDFYMSIFPEPMEDSKTESDIINAKGFWSRDEETVSLNFTERKKNTLNLNALFDSNFKENNEFKVINKNTVEIDYSLEKLNVWGISCRKLKK